MSRIDVTSHQLVLKIWFIWGHILWQVVQFWDLYNFECPLTRHTHAHTHLFYVHAIHTHTRTCNWKSIRRDKRLSRDFILEVYENLFLSVIIWLFCVDARAHTLACDEHTLFYFYSRKGIFGYIHYYIMHILSVVLYILFFC